MHVVYSSDPISQFAEGKSSRSDGPVIPISHPKRSTDFLDLFLNLIAVCTNFP
jgi:hypothetical protein